MSPMPDYKSLFASKTFWVNALATLAAGLTGVAGAGWVQESPQAAAFVTMGVSIVNIVLRYVTTQRVKLG